MKKALNLQGLILIAALICPFIMKAQIDSARLSTSHIDQYICPPLIDSLYESNIDEFDWLPSMAISDLLASFSNELYYTKKIAQKYEVRNDSLKISGVSILSDPSKNPYPDTLIVGIMNNSMSVLSQKTFIVNAYQTNNMYGYYEFLFDDTITVYDDYIVFLDLLSAPCNISNLQKNKSIMICFHKRRHWSSSGSLPPCGGGTKYKPYVAFCYDKQEWMSVDNVEWSSYGYNQGAKYAQSNCDTNVYAPLAIFPIRVLEDSIPQGDSTITDTASSALSANLLNEESVRVYPNPASEVLNVASDYNILNVAIFDAMNRLVEEKEVNAKNIRINLAQRSAGVYFIKVRTDRGSTMRKFVVR